MSLETCICGKELLTEADNHAWILNTTGANFWQVNCGCYFKKPLEIQVAELKEKLREMAELTLLLIDDIETPSRLGLADPVNPEWNNFNKAKEYIKKLAEIDAIMKGRT